MSFKFFECSVSNDETFVSFFFKRSSSLVDVLFVADPLQPNSFESRIVRANLQWQEGQEDGKLWVDLRDTVISSGWVERVVGPALDACLEADQRDGERSDGQCWQVSAFTESDAAAAQVGGSHQSIFTHTPEQRSEECIEPPSPSTTTMDNVRVRVDGDIMRSDNYRTRLKAVSDVLRSFPTGKGRAAHRPDRDNDDRRDTTEGERAHQPSLYGLADLDIDDRLDSSSGQVFSARLLRPKEGASSPFGQGEPRGLDGKNPVSDKQQVALKFIHPGALRLHAEFAEHMLSGFYNELSVLLSIPPHPSIVSAPLGLVTIPSSATQVPGGEQQEPSSPVLVCGFLLPFYPGGPLSEHLPGSSLSQRLAWASQLSSAVLHLHRAGKTYHGDLKVSNLVLAAPPPHHPGRIVLIDFEQGRTNKRAHAPEIRGGWDVDVGRDGRLSYRPHERGGGGAGEQEQEREITEGVWGGWSAWREWKDIPEALERAEVYSLGIVLGDILAGRNPDDDEEEEEEEEEQGGAGHVAVRIPAAYTVMVERCQYTDPLRRPLLDEVAEFFAEAASRETFSSSP